MTASIHRLVWTLLVGLVLVLPTGHAVAQAGERPLAKKTERVQRLAQATEAKPAAKGKRKRKSKRRQRKPEPEAATEQAEPEQPEAGLEPDAPEATAAPLTATQPGGSLRRSNRMEFDARLIRGETAGSGAVVLFDRGQRVLPPLTEDRKRFVDATVEEVYGADVAGDDGHQQPKQSKRPGKAPEKPAAKSAAKSAAK